MMDFKYLHLINKTRPVQSLKRLIGNKEGHRIVVLQNNTKYYDTEEISDSTFHDWVHYSDVFFVHFLDYQKAKVINRLEDEKKIVWFFWGGDGYYLGKFSNDFLLPKTKKAKWKLSLQNISKGGWKDLVKMIFGSLTDYIYPNHHVLNAIQKVDVIVPIVPQDYDWLAEKYDISARKYHLNYINDAFYTEPEVNLDNNQGNILLGNSASYTNNHIEAIDKIAKKKLGNRKVIIPLSYGEEYYGRYVKKYADKVLGKNAMVLDDYLPLDDYRELIESCDIMMMNQCRQQALGNVIIALWFQKTLYMNKRSGLYQYLVENDFKIKAISNFDFNNVLSMKEREYNKKQLHDVFGPDRQQQRFGELLKLLQDI